MTMNESGVGSDVAFTTDITGQIPRTIAEGLRQCGLSIVGQRRWSMKDEDGRADCPVHNAEALDLILSNGWVLQLYSSTATVAHGPTWDLLSDDLAIFVYESIEYDDLYDRGQFHYGEPGRSCVDLVELAADMASLLDEG